LKVEEQLEAKEEEPERVFLKQLYESLKPGQSGENRLVLSGGRVSEEQLDSLKQEMKNQL